jgi:hypothetical protein
MVMVDREPTVLANRGEWVVLPVLITGRLEPAFAVRLNSPPRRG